MKINTVLILAGGIGSRLLPVTKGKIPKPLINIYGKKSVLEINIDYFNKLGVKNIYVSVSHLKEKILKKINNSNIFFLEEKKLLGTGGAIYNFIISNNQRKPFFVVPADNLLDFNGLKTIISNNYKLSEKRKIACWCTTSSNVNLIEQNVKKNIIYSKKTGEMVEYLSNFLINDVKKIKNKYSKKLYRNTTSLGLVAINPLIFNNFITKNKIIMPFCLYKDLAPLWIYGNKKQRMAVDVFTSNVKFIDIGTPERLIAAKKWLISNNLRKMPIIIAHKGMTNIESIPNSIESFIEAINMGVDGIEMDVQFTKDQHIIVNHHSYIIKNNKQILISKINYEQINNKIATLEQVLLALKKQSIKIILDVKSSNIECFKEIILLITKYGYKNFFEITSREPLLLKLVKDYSCYVQTGLILDSEKIQPWMDVDYIIEYFIQISKISKVDYLHIPLSIKNIKEISKILHENKIKIHGNHQTKTDLEMIKKYSIDQLTTENLKEVLSYNKISSKLKR